jgi:SAF domain-containing protein
MNAAIRISERDNVATALEALEAGQQISVGEAAITLAEAVPRGHKVAIRAIEAGEPVVKYGSAIGTASTRIAAGAHVHTHNVASGRGRGDLRRAVPGDGARLAEPDDEATAKSATTEDTD